MSLDEKTRRWVSTASLVMLLTGCRAGLERNDNSQARPSAGLADAVFIPAKGQSPSLADHTGGEWLHCWLDETNSVNWCRLSKVDGSVEYEGSYFSYHGSGAVPSHDFPKRAELEGRSDDTPEVIAKRLDVYHSETEPIVEHYRASGKLVPVHAERTVPEVYAEIQAALAELEEAA